MHQFSHTKILPNFSATALGNIMQYYDKSSWVPGQERKRDMSWYLFLPKISDVLTLEWVISMHFRIKNERMEMMYFVLFISS